MTSFSSPLQTGDDFCRLFEQALQICDWEPHPHYSVFTQYDQEFYLHYEPAFQLKYRCMWAVSKVIQPRIILEFGTNGGSSADAYISASPDTIYFGIDLFPEDIYFCNDGSPWQPLEVARALFKAREFDNYYLLPADLRALDASQIPSANLVVVDAAHDFENEYADLKLALAANPEFIFVDDSEGDDAKQAIAQFTKEQTNSISWVCNIAYIGGGCVIKLK